MSPRGVLFFTTRARTILLKLQGSLNTLFQVRVFVEEALETFLIVVALAPVIFKTYRVAIRTLANFKAHIGFLFTARRSRRSLQYSFNALLQFRVFVEESLKLFAIRVVVPALSTRRQNDGHRNKKVSSETAHDNCVN